MSISRESIDFFRAEVVEARNRRLYGDVVITSSLPTRLLTAGIVVICLLGSIWAASGSFARTETARGVLTPASGYAKIIALRPGVIVKLMVRDGDHVVSGQHLATVQVENPAASGVFETEEELASIASQSALARQQIALSTERSRKDVTRLAAAIGGLRGQLTALEEQADLQAQIVRSMEATFAEVAPVVSKGYISKIDYERRRQALLTAREDLSRLRQQTESTRAEIARSEAEGDQASIDGRRDQTNARSTLETVRQQRSKAEGTGSYAIIASVGGVVTSLQAAVGRAVDPSRPIMIIIPLASPLRAELFVPTKAIGFVRPGQEIRLLYDAFPYQRFGSHVAHIRTISHLAISGQETDAPFKLEEPVYRVTADLDQQTIDAYGSPLALQPGMTVTGNIVLERQSFFAWLLDPLRAVAKRNS